MLLGLTRNESVRAALRRVVRRRCEHAVELLQRPPGTHMDEGVHESRRQIKHIRALLKLIRRELGAGRAARADALLQGVMHALSSLRDAQIMLATIGELHEASAISDDSHGALRCALDARWRRRQRRVLSDRGRRRLAKALRRALRLITQGTSIGRGWKAIGTGLRRTYQAGRAAAAAISTRRSDQPLHRTRKRTKDLLYALDFLQAIPAQSLRGSAATARRITELLGADHDLAVLARALRRELKSALPPGEQARLTAIVAGRRAALQLEASIAIQRLYAESPDDFVRRIHGLWRRWRHGPVRRSRRHPGRAAAHA